MFIFEYKVIDKNGNKRTGLVEAENIDIAFDILKDRSFNVISLEQKAQKRFSGSSMLFQHISIKDVVIFSRQFAVLVGANVSLVQSFKILVEQTANPKFKMILSEVADEIDGGIRLSDALAKRANVFSEFYVSVVRSGETSGKLDEILEYLADEMEKDYDMMSKIKGAMIYPIFIFCGLVGVGIVMMVYVVPKLTAIITESGGELPIATRILIATSNFFVDFWWLMIIIAAGIASGLIIYGKTRQGKFVYDWLKLRMPVFGKLLQKIYLVRFTRSMETLILGGVTISNSLRIAGDVVSNEIYKQIIHETIKEVEDGNSIASVFETRKEIPNMVSEMMSIGEKTGKLDAILAQITHFYSREINNVVSNLMSLIEPVIMLILGLAVGTMVAAIILPMYNVASSY